LGVAGWEDEQMPDGTTRHTGPLRPIELATAAVLAALATILTVLGWFLPHLGFIGAFAVVPLGVVGHHHRLRALLAATFAAALLCFLVAGTGSVGNIIECATIGGLVGIAKRREWGAGAVVVGVAIIAPVLAGASVGTLYVFSSLRRLTLQQIVNGWHGARQLINGVIALLRALAHLFGRFVQLHLGVSLPKPGSRLTPINSVITDAVKHWWIAVAVVVIGATIWFALLGWLFLGQVLERLEWVRASDRLDLDPEPSDRPPGPVPARMEAVAFRYPGADRDAVAGVDLVVAADEMLALVGDNGSGKSTIVRLLAGRSPTSGRIERPGPAGLGRAGGTALIMQHPETQVLGVRVADDVVWGLRDAAGVDIEALLETVGLGGMADRETSGLSGGELQRLAVAAALARRPQLLLSDESTAMVDEKGREELVSLLRRLPAAGTAVVHVTHRPEEAQAADRRHQMSAGVLVGDAGEPPEPSGVESDGVPREAPARPERLDIRGVSHTYGIGSPWATTALVGVDLTVEPGEGLLIVGGNGSGKSTLAWIMAGLLRPSHGACRLGGEPVHTRIGSVGLAFQHARLQLQRATVAKDVRAAGAADDDEVAAALKAVGLDGPEIADQRIDTLSGGQQRRVALAGLLGRRPSVIVLDEPLAGLDRPSREGLIDLLAGLRRDHGLTVVVISHDLHGMERVCDRVVGLDAGRIVSDASTLVADR
jgi:energy-coupling factor transporter ATP-binding protein EcfA2